MGKGDMFYLSPKQGLIRLHAPLISQEDISKTIRIAIELGSTGKTVWDYKPVSETQVAVTQNGKSAPAKSNGEKVM